MPDPGSSGDAPRSFQPSVSVIVPAYNSEGTLEALVQRILRTLEGRVPDHEIILVNDNSRDRSWQVIEAIAAREPRVIGLDLMRNYGQHNALLAGIRAARFEVVVTLDDDLQNPPEEIPALLAELQKGFDIVYGRPARERHGLFRDLASQITKLALQGAMGIENARNVSAFRAFRTILREGFAGYRGSFTSIDVLLTWSTTRFSSVEVRHDRREIGKSNYSWWRLVTHALNMTTGLSVLPLQLASVAGFFFAFFGLCIFVYVVGRYLLQGGSVPGFSFLASTIAIFAGVQLVAIGVIGEYLARAYVRIMDRPCYVVRGRAGDPAVTDRKEDPLSL